MKKSLLIATIALLVALFAVTTVFAGSGFSQTYVARDQSYSFAYPDDWQVGFNTDYQAPVVSNERVDVFVFGPADAQSFELAVAPTTAVEFANALAQKWADIVQGPVMALEVGGRPAARVDFLFHNAPGFFLVIDLGNGAFAVFEPFGYESSALAHHEATIYAIAESFVVLGEPMPDAILDLQDSFAVSTDEGDGEFLPK
jgi:hypothetical protein